MRDRPQDRRTLLTGALTAAAGLALPAGASRAASPGGQPDLSSPSERLRLFIRMRGALDERLVLSYIECRYWGVVNAQMTPFYNLVGATFSRYRPSPGGGYAVRSYEIEYFIDRDTGEVLNAWTNPYTGKTVTAKHVASPPLKYVIGPDGQIQDFPKPTAPGATFAFQTLPLRVLGDDVWTTETSTARIPVAGSKPLYFNEKVINHARLTDLARSDAPHVKTDSTYVGVSSFRPWQEMGDLPGEMLGLGHGAVGVEMRDLPESWTAAARIHNPQILIDPAAYVDALWNAL
jgi:hypothetical protein